MSNNKKNDKDWTNLTNLLLDIDRLNELESRKFNVFDVLKISRTEIRHSNVLAWLMDPYETHGLGHTVLSMLNAHLVKYKIIPLNNAIKVLTMKYSDVVVYREWMNIDILIVSPGAKYVLCIENKIDTQDHSNQLNRYHDTIDKKYHDYTKTFLYLTPEGLEPNENTKEAWHCFDYETIVEILEQTLEKCSANREVADFIASYCEILRREIMKDDRIIALCQSIYKDHKYALDLIYENRPDRLQNVSEYFKAWCEKQNPEEIIWDKDKSIKSNTRFRTKKFDSLSIPKNANNNSGWKTQNNYYYEISAECDNNDDVKYFIKLVFSLITLSEDDKEKIENISKEAKNFEGNKLQARKSNEWKTVFKCEPIKIESSVELPEDLYENEISTNLTKMWKTIKNSGLEELVAKYFPE